MRAFLHALLDVAEARRDIIRHWESRPHGAAVLLKRPGMVAFRPDLAPWHERAGELGNAMADAEERAVLAVPRWARCRFTAWLVWWFLRRRKCRCC